MSKTFSKEVREDMHNLSAGYCMCSKDCMESVTEFHHMLPNTIPNQSRFPLFLQSPFNCLPINNGCHLNKPKKKISERQAAVYERWLEKLLGGSK